jgi:nucleoside-diphosphate-sugar epimerase
LKAIITGLLRRNSESFLIHLSGTGILSDFKDTTAYRGRLNPKIWSDIDSIDEITSRPAGSLHRHTDALIQEAAVKHGDKLKAAIVCPPDIYGRGHGPGGNQSVFFPSYIKESIKIGAPFYTNEGTNTRGWVHIDDVMELYVSLVEAAVAGGGSITWGKQVSISLILADVGPVNICSLGLLFLYFSRSNAKRCRCCYCEDSALKGRFSK